MTTLEELLVTTVKSHGKDGPVDIRPDFRVSVQRILSGGGVHFIVHPDGHDGDTLDYVVRGNNLQRI